MKASLTIADLVEVPEVQTVIRLDQGKTEPREITRSFVFTRETSDHFTVITDALMKKKGLGYFLQGDFGSGKSHFLACLYAILDNPQSGANLDHGGIKRFTGSEKKILPVDISLINYRAKSSLEQIIVESIEKALISRGHEADMSPLSAFISWFITLLKNPSLASSFCESLAKKENELIPWIRNEPKEAYQKALPFLQSKGIDLPELLTQNRDESFEQAFSQVREASYDGVFLIIDELSEFFRSKPDSHALNEDARTLQYLGEKTQQQAFWIIGAVQESIEKTGDIAQSTFRKIKDRFPVKLVLSTLHIRSLISERLVKQKELAQETLPSLYDEFKNQFKGFSLPYSEFRAIYPVHPATISLLDGLGDLFSVHRGIVDFVHAQLAGDPRRDIPGILQRPAMELLAPDSIYDHFRLRISEFSAFHVYSRHILPHLEKVINEVIEDDKNREFALRLMKILILYKIHPTAQPPKAGELAELISCALFFQNADLNVRYLTEGLLDPVAEHSPFLQKKSSPDTPVEDRIYEIITEEQPLTLLEKRLDPILKELTDDDSRLILLPLSELEESPAWPGKALLLGGIEQTMDWLHSSRRAFIYFCLNPDKTELDEFYYAYKESNADFALLVTGKGEVPQMENTALWRLSDSPAQIELLREYAALKILKNSLLPGNPSDKRIVDELNNRLIKTSALARAVLLDYLYSGSFFPEQIDTIPLIKQLKRFDRIIETAGAALLEKRYPRYKDIAPRRMAPSPRLYQQLLDEFVQPGSISFSNARPRGLHNIIEALASPLGLVEARSGSFVFSPEINDHPLLREFFEHVPAASKTPLEKLKNDLTKGPFGLNDLMFHFLVASLALSGLITLIRGQRAIPLSLINLISSQKAEEIAPGELISKADQEVLALECGGLFPMLSRESFGLSLQRELWKAMIKFKESLTRLSEDISEILQKNTGFSAFSGFKLDEYEKKYQALGLLMEAIKISYPAKEGIQSFLTSWRGSGLTEEDVLYLKKFSHVFKEKSRSLIFIHHYLKHPETIKAARLDQQCNEQRNRVLQFFAEPVKTIVPDQGEALEKAFSRFMKSYGSFYSKKHEAYYRSFELTKPSKYLKRALAMAQELARIPVLDRPRDLDNLLDSISKRGEKSCSQRLIEVLQASPTCSCGYLLEAQAETTSMSPDEMIENVFSSYLESLSRPVNIEAIHSWAFAMQDKNKVVAQELSKLCAALEEKKLSKTGLMNFLSDDMVKYLGQALSVHVKIEKRSFYDLEKMLTGRHLSSADIKNHISQWLGQTDEDTIFVLSKGTHRTDDNTKEDFSWWPYYHKNQLFKKSRSLDFREPQNMEAALEKTYPAVELKTALSKLSSDGLADFAEKECFHYYGIIKAWQILASRLFNQESPMAVRSFSSAFYSEDRAEEVNHAFGLLYSLVLREKLDFPGQLSLRLTLAEILTRPFMTEELIQSLFHYLGNWEKNCDHWLSSLKPVTAIDKDSNPVVIICDGLPADLWLEAVEEKQIEWYSLTSACETLASLKALFDLKVDPMDAFHSQDMDYYTVRGNEEGSLTDHLRPLGSKTTVLRLNLFDRAAHSGSLNLPEMAAAFKVLAQREFPKLKEFCDKEKRLLIITTDHGLSLTRQGLSHGAGGVFERIIPRIEYPVKGE